ncbi:type II CAAX endopeptidase family protein [Paenibacillus taiwanensis]|uniref:type II CAAX endopeptidase family protein n=1 Tax=Paenibacillus taiwanensis TaxID=401638 RepID=UPI0004083F85|nr:type II CAAX endopeptidase family protein [Paenibacillus taiwanensis]
MSKQRTGLYLLFTYVLTYVSWTIYAIYIHRIDSTLNFSDHMGVLMLLGLMGPTISAYLAIACTKKHGGFKTYHQQFRWNFGWRWLAIAIGLPILLGGLGYIFGFILEPEGMRSYEIRAFYTFLPALFSSIVFGGLEELGWRGLLLPSLLVRLGYYRSTLIVGVAWTLWHIPLFFIPDSGQYGNNFAIYMIELIGYSAILTWLYVRTSSVILAVLFHASFNAISYVGLYAPKASTLSYAVFAIALVIFGFGLVSRLKEPSKYALTEGPQRDAKASV